MKPQKTVLSHQPFTRDYTRNNVAGQEACLVWTTVKSLSREPKITSRLSFVADSATNEADDNVSTAGDTVTTADDGTAGATASVAPKGSRVVDEDGVTWRIDPDGNRVRLEGVRIVTEDGVRYRVDPDGTRVRIDPEGIDIDIDTPDLTPDVDVGINKKGNPDVDVKTDSDGDEGPN